MERNEVIDERNRDEEEEPLLGGVLNPTLWGESLTCILDIMLLMLRQIL